MCWYGPHAARRVLAVSLCVPFLQQRQTNQFHALKWQRASIKKIQLLIKSIPSLPAQEMSCMVKNVLLTLLWLQLLSCVYSTLWRFGSQDSTNKRLQLLLNECNIGPSNHWRRVSSAFWPNIPGYHPGWNIFSCPFSICLLFCLSWESAASKGCP